MSLKNLKLFKYSGKNFLFLDIVFFRYRILFNIMKRDKKENVANE